jgi:hypothetical protein
MSESHLIMKFKAHIPAFVDIDTNPCELERITIEEILNNKWIKQWNEPPKDDFKYCWSLNDGEWSKAILMAEWKENGKRTWWVLGYLSDIPSNLPKWRSADGE